MKNAHNHILNYLYHFLLILASLIFIPLVFHLDNLLAFWFFQEFPQCFFQFYQIVYLIILFIQVSQTIILRD